MGRTVVVPVRVLLLVALLLALNGSAIHGQGDSDSLTRGIKRLHYESGTTGEPLAEALELWQYGDLGTYSHFVIRVDTLAFEIRQHILLLGDSVVVGYNLTGSSERDDYALRVAYPGVAARTLREAIEAIDEGSLFNVTVYEQNAPVCSGEDRIGESWDASVEAAVARCLEGTSLPERMAVSALAAGLPRLMELIGPGVDGFDPRAGAYKLQPVNMQLDQSLVGATVSAGCRLGTAQGLQHLYLGTTEHNLQIQDGSQLTNGMKGFVAPNIFLKAQGCP